MRRFPLFFVAAALLALGASACSSTLNDAATIKFSLSGKDHEEHVTRADLIVGGVAIVEATLDQLAIEQLTVSDWSLREGLVAELAARQV